MVSNETEALSDERLALVKRALQRIASDHELTPTGHHKKLPRHQAINIAREVCEALGWSYSKPRDEDQRISESEAAGKSC